MTNNNSNHQNKPKQVKPYMIWLVLSFVSFVSYAQLPPGFDSSVEDAELPISGLVALGLVVGGFLGIKKLRKNK
ncbi:hypothetical protein [Psychroflexus aestuariivivens]|uniref:hypothetical protein n=1 Tax=Psychroflexus aestuariivivens TaxID=1795040 RepID=UPI000FDB4493|nr:hypothetical protein [Psychroflexus aestuariivivens]